MKTNNKTEERSMWIDPHIHMCSRTTDDYQAMQAAGIVAVIEPAFWQGQPRTSAGSFRDYFSSLVGWERFRAGQCGIRHYCAIGLNAKEANNEALAEEVMELLPLLILVPTLLFALMNGANDSGTMAASVVSSRCLSPRVAVDWACIASFLGALLLGLRGR